MKQNTLVFCQADVQEFHLRPWTQIHLKCWIRIRIQLIQIHNTGHNCAQLDFFPLLDEESGDGYRPCDPSIIVGGWRYEEPFGII